MNWYLLGLCLVILWLGVQALGNHFQTKALINAFSAFTDIVGTVANIPEKELGQARTQWELAKARSDQRIGMTMLILLAVLVFFCVLVARGHI